MNKTVTRYKDAGVDVEAGQRLIEQIKQSTASTHRPEVLNNLGGFAALCRIPHDFHHPVLVSSTDGVGTKLRLAIEWERHQTIGIDLVAMCVNDVLVQGGMPLFFLDYFATGSLDLRQAATVIDGVAQGCKQAGCALVGGETAEMPGFYQKGDYDLAGFCVGVVEHDAIVDGHRLRDGDVLIGLHSSGLHANGYSLIRLLLEQSQIGLDEKFDGTDLKSVLMEPTRIYVQSVLQLLDQYPVHGMCHVTGGGMTENLPRVLPEDLSAVVEKKSWIWPEVFQWLQEESDQDDVDMLSTFNCGIGYILIVPRAQAQHCIDMLNQSGERALKIGQLTQKERKNASSIVFV